MMPGPNTPVIKGNKSYGDRTALDRLAIAGSGLKQGNADYVPTQRNPVGRPPGATNVVRGNPAMGTDAIPPEHTALMKDFSRASLVAQIGEAGAQDMMAGPWLRKYAEFARREVQRRAEALRNQTPMFE